VADIQSPAILGEMGLIADALCTATAFAKTALRAMVLPAEAFHRLARKHNVLWVALNRLIAQRLGHGEIDVLIGKVFHGYRIGRMMGRGGMGVVYEAEAIAGGRPVALKMMSHRLTHNFEAQARFEREGQICRSFEHPNILRIYDCFTSFGTNFLVMELCDGVTLAEVVDRRGALAEPEVRKILGQLAAALGYAHTRGVCHRDLKPSNIMLDRSGTLKLMDFGLAKSADSAGVTMEGCLLGTLPYMAPEQLSGKPGDRQSDIFATGCIAWEMLTGQPLFPRSEVFEVLSAHAKWTLPPADEIRPGLPSDLYDFLRKSLARKPEERTLDLECVSHWAGPVDHDLAGV
jgi:serine/threonine-protein kinase